MMQPLIKIENLSVTYNQGESAEFRALKSINLEIFEGEYVVFFGPSGSGKSTLLYVIAGLESPTEGHVFFREGDKKFRDLSTLSETELVAYHKDFVGMVFQAFYLIPTLTAKENIELPSILQKTEKTIRDAQVTRLMERFGVAQFKDRIPARLSGGQQQRVAIARALVNNPTLILADEPVGNLDSENAAIVVDMISDLNKTDNKTVIHVTHDPRHLALAERVFYINDGEIKRVTVNHTVKHPSRYKGMKRRSAVSDKIATLHPYADEASLQAKLILDHLVSPYTFHEMERIESIIVRYMNKEITEARMRELFDAPESEGGVNLYHQSAEKLTKEIASLVQEIDLLSQQEKKHIPYRTQAAGLLHYIQDMHDFELSALQESRALDLLAQRLSGEIDENELRIRLDLPLAKEGVGLHKRLVDRVVNDIELLLAQTKLSYDPS
jgi:putative ABC transport system ATP-binding protein